jgi:hypothetical protein
MKNLPLPKTWSPIIVSIFLLSLSACWQFFGSDSIAVKVGKGLKSELIQLQLSQGAASNYKAEVIVEKGQRTAIEVKPSTQNTWEVMYGDSLSRGFSMSKKDGRQDYNYQFEYYLDRFGQTCVRVLVNGRKMEDFALYSR